MSDVITDIDGYPGGRDALADQYVLGILDEATSELVATAVEVAPDWRHAVVASQERFLPLALTAEPLDLGPEFWAGIEARLNGEQPTRVRKITTAPISAPSSVPTSANDNAQTAIWRRRAIAASVACLLAVGGLFWSVSRTPEPTVIAILLNDSNEPQVMIEDFGGETARVTLLTDYDVPADRSIQVWTLPNREMGPTSLGLLTPGETVTLDFAKLPMPLEQQLYEITLEQQGGSPTGRPTGPILAKGFAKRPR